VIRASPPGAARVLVMSDSDGVDGIGLSRVPASRTPEHPATLHMRGSATELEAASGKDAEVGCIHGLSVLVRCREGSKLSVTCEEECFGSMCGDWGVMLLTLEEALFLVAERRVLPLRAFDAGAPHAMLGEGQSMADAMFWYSCNAVVGFPQRYAAYRHFRLKGWVVRPDAVKFGADFLLYDGPVDECHAQYAVIVANKGITVKEVLMGSRLAQLVAKELLLVFFLGGDSGGLQEPARPFVSLSSFMQSEQARITEIVAKQWFPHGR